MSCIRYFVGLAAGLMLFPVSAGAVQMQNSEARGIYFPPPGESIADQDRRRPEDVGMHPQFIARIKERMKGNAELRADAQPSALERLVGIFRIESREQYQLHWAKILSRPQFEPF